MFVQSVIPCPEAKDGDLSGSIKSVVVISGFILFASDNLDSSLFLKEWDYIHFLFTFSSLLCKLICHLISGYTTVGGHPL